MSAARTPRPSARIEDYALIGDCETAALVSRDGSVDWLCWPRFDSDACFAALLGDDDHGRWRLAPCDPGARSTRRYLPDTLILETRYETAEGAVRVLDFMPPRGEASDIVRLVQGERGCVPMRMELILRFGYGTVVPWVTRGKGGALCAIAGPDAAVLHTPVPTRGENLRTVAEFAVAQGDSVPFVLTYHASSAPLPRAIDAQDALEQTEAFWSEWARRYTPHAHRPELVLRSLITLKALTHAPTGGIVAAPTTSLPECLGGARNWDYRYCWLRDATLTLLALMNAGYYDEARAWRDWLLRAVAGSPAQLQILYGVGGERRQAEWEADWLPGYAGSRPVRIGNAAVGQLQLDVYGELMDALHHGRKGDLGADEAGWALQQALLEHLESRWREPDRGIWEVRGPPQHFTYSKAMAWVAFDRAVKTVEEFGQDGPVDRWRRCRDALHAEICTRGYDAGRGSFVQAYGSPHLDASLLLLPQLGFLPARDPRVLGTIAAVERELLHEGFVLRYDTGRTDDGLPPGEGAFLACSFWLADAYVLSGRRDDALALFERLAGVGNDLGLLAEEYDVGSQRLVGNFPQAFSHVALINTAANLHGSRPPAQQRAEKAASA